MAAYDDAQVSATEDVIEDTAVGPALRQLLEETGSFDGTATELLDLLDARRDARRQDEKRPRGWPSTGAVMGRQLMRLAPTLRQAGYVVETRRTKRGNVWELEAPGQGVGSG